MLFMDSHFCWQDFMVWIEMYSSYILFILVIGLIIFLLGVTSRVFIGCINMFLVQSAFWWLNSICFFISWRSWGTFDHAFWMKDKQIKQVPVFFCQCEAPKIAKLVNITPIMVYGIYNELVTGAFVNQLTYLGGITLYENSQKKV